MSNMKQLVKMEPERNLNMPPAEWFRGVWYAEQKRQEAIVLQLMQSAARAERIRNRWKNVGYALAALGVFALWLYGCIFIGA